VLAGAEPRLAGVAAVSRRRLDVDGRVLAISAGLTLFVFVVIRTAWMCDDAYITLRTIDNFVNGYGLRWNVDERVQAFTNPLWLMLLSAPYAVTREAFFTTLVVSIALASAAVWLFMTRIASSLEAMLIGLAACIFSKAFVEFSTSGLENPLTTFLLAVFFAVYFGSGRRRRLTLWATVGLLMLNRLDAAALVLPIVLADGWSRGWRPMLRDAVVGLAPLAAWEIFSVVYYGFPVPNTAYAKLQTGITTQALAGQGALYLIDSIAHDPVTLLVIATSIILCVGRDAKRMWPVAVGIVLYLACMIRVGGDFMSGRFLAAPFFCAVAGCARLRWAPSPTNAGCAVGAIALIGLTATTHPPMTSGAETFADGPEFGVSGVADERSWDYPNAGLLRWTRERPLPAGDWAQYGRALHGQPRVVVRANIGLFGYFAGPTPHIIDAYGLSDPLLARLPARQPWRIGHFERDLPDGYEQTVQTGMNHIADPQVAALYDDLKLITQARLWNRARWRAIWRRNLGSRS